MMKAAMFDRHGDADVLYIGSRERPVPVEGEVLIRVAAIAVNPADTKWRAGMFAKHIPLHFPHVPGYDLAGVIEIGTADLPAGTRVAAILDAHRQGAYAEWAVTRAKNVGVLPDDLDLAVAAALPTAGLTGVQMIEQQLDVQPGQRVLITGATGAVGRFAIHSALARRARVVAAVRPAYRQEAVELGAEAVIALGAEDWDGEPFDHIADTVGGAIVEPFCRQLKEGGLIRTVSTTPIPADALVTKPVFFPVHADSARLAQLAQAVARGELTVPVAEILPLDQATQAQAKLERGGVEGKLILRP